MQKNQQENTAQQHPSRHPELNIRQDRPDGLRLTSSIHVHFTFSIIGIREISAGLAVALRYGRGLLLPVSSTQAKAGVSAGLGVAPWNGSLREESVSMSASSGGGSRSPRKIPAGCCQIVDDPGYDSRSKDLVGRCPLGCDELFGGKPDDV